MTENYYTMKRNAIKDIDRLLYDNKSKEWIIYFICGKYGVSEKLVKERIEQKEELDNKLIQQEKPTKPNNEI